MRPVIAAYRELLRAQRQLFAGDAAARTSALAETRQAFMSNAGASEDEVPAMVQEALDAATFIRQNIAQTVLNERGNYGQCTQPRLHPTSTLARTPCRYAQARPRPDTCRTDPEGRAPTSCTVAAASAE